MNTPESDVMKIELHPISEEEDLGFFACMTIDRPDKLNALNADAVSYTHLTLPTILLV